MFSSLWKPGPRPEPAASPRTAAFAPKEKIAQALVGLGFRPAKDSAVYSRHSNGLEQFFSYIQGVPGLRLLDLSGASQANVGFITSLGHNLYSEDFMTTLDLAFGNGDVYRNQAVPENAAAFLDNTLKFPDNHFDGALIWDVLEFLAPPLLKAVVERLQRIVKPRSYILACFHAEERSEVLDVHSYRIGGAGTLLLAPRGRRRPAQYLNNRAVEKLFQQCESVKFFLSRDALREVIVKR